MRSERSIRVYLSSEEYDLLTAEAARRGLPGSTYIRLIVLERLDGHSDARRDPREPAEAGD